MRAILPGWLSIYTVTDGRIASGWFGEDALRLMLPFGIALNGLDDSVPIVIANWVRNVGND